MMFLLPAFQSQYLRIIKLIEYAFAMSLKQSRLGMKKEFQFRV
jgi:hypothetical protein